MITSLVAREVKDLPVVAFDLETTGLTPVAHRIVEIAAVKSYGGRVLRTFHSLVDPEIPIPQEVVRIHGITDELVAGQPRITEVLPGFVEFVGSSLLVAHNAPFDMGFLSYELLRMSASPPENPVLDTLALARSLFCGLPSYTLEHLSSFLKVRPGGFHRALVDSHSCLQIFIRSVAQCDPTLDIPLSRVLSGRGPLLSFRDFMEGDVTPSPHSYLLKEAIETGTPVEITYTDSRNATSTRRITPHSLIPFKGSIYIEALCHTSGERRTFRLDRISRIGGYPA